MGGWGGGFDYFTGHIFTTDRAVVITQNVLVG